MHLLFKWPIRLCYLALLLLAIQCGGAATPTPIAREPVTLTIVSADMGSAWEAAADQTIAQFQTTEPNITFARQSFSQAPESYLAQSPAPDILLSGAYAFLAQAAQQNQVLDLTELWTETGLREAFPTGLQTLSVYEGKQYYLPIGYAWTAIYYNRALFAQYDLQPPRTWDEFMVICDTLLVNGETPLALAGQDTWLTMLWFDYLNMRLNGVDFHRALVQGQIPYTDGRVRTAVELWSQLLRNGYVVERPDSVDIFRSLTALVRDDGGLMDGQKAAMTLVSPFWMTALPDKFHGELDFFRFPGLDPAVAPAEVVMTLGYMAPNRGAHLPETLAYLAYLGSNQGQTIMAQQLGKGATWAPARADVDAALLSPVVQQGKALVSDAPDFVAPYVLSLPTQMWPLIDPALRQFLRNPDQIDEFVNQLEAARQQALDAGWLRES